MLGECVPRLVAMGIETSDAWQLRRVAMTLHRWHESECGDSSEYASYCIVRGYRDSPVSFVYDDTREPYMETHVHSMAKPIYRRIPDRERGAQKRLAAIMARYPSLLAYVQTDPRGASLYVLRRDMVPDGAAIDSCYSRGIAVYK